MQTDSQTLTLEDFDARLTAATKRAQQERLALEAENAELRDLIARYSATLERLESELATAKQGPLPTAAQMRETLKQLAERSAAVAAAL